MLSINVSSVFLNIVLIITLSEWLPEGPHIYTMKLIFTIVIGVHRVCNKSIICLRPVPIFELQRFLGALQKPALYPHRYYMVKKLNGKNGGLIARRLI